VAVAMLTSCEHSRTGTISIRAWDHSHVTVPCARLRR
jgi:hypothetical protein